MARALLEVAAGSLASALAAQEGGADRVELCGSLAGGGVTPSYGLIAAARERLRIPLYVLVRPRAGDFLYDDAELDAMCRDVEACARLGCDGVAIGALDADGEVDQARCRALVAAAGKLGVTFHRAFDAARHPSRALEEIVALGCERVLTSGGRADALEGAPAIAALAAQAAGRIRVMAGAGIRPDNLAAVAARSHADEFHASARALRRSAMHWRNEQLRDLAPDREESDAATVAALAAALRGAAPRD
ncbi:copper homeostasis protein CutC [Fulvimonas soli]|jgi:copper homeostasis protein|uniref:PF03932 family protein CutC n=1 Tax=Fulvimonas soli TaxID=155197 RepID=A0A316IZY5_9GAMM|nr:copper homeostasis protein CutC [Fulvimonas soli]PWK92825.1 copper homeostasis protein CutC [Fulvimonas soli]TNY26458.1 copper homeostasis protein CutC [Fulvimonas soli]